MVVKVGTRAGGRERRWAAALLRWYDRHRRDLPWRGRAEPYAVWVSEIMLQQTQVAAARPYYERFLRAFPTLRALAAAEEQDVLRLWEGLGYYARARQLHRAARLIAARPGAAWPRTAAEWRRLPGVGPYTAAAIASICFGERTPAVDGNVRRVGARALGLRTDPRAPRAARRLARWLERAMPPARLGDFNQALMELGALLCRPRRPACERCPWCRGCAARAAGQTAQIPVRPPRRAPRRVALAAAVALAGGRVLIQRRPRRGLLGGLWGFPAAGRRGAEPWAAAAARALRRRVRTAAAADRGALLGVWRHGYSHFSLRLRVYRWRLQRPAPLRPGSEPAEWAPLAALGAYPMSALDRRIAAALCAPPGSAAGRGAARGAARPAGKKPEGAARVFLSAKSGLPPIDRAEESVVCWRPNEQKENSDDAGGNLGRRCGDGAGGGSRGAPRDSGPSDALLGRLCLSERRAAPVVRGETLAVGPLRVSQVPEPRELSLLHSLRPGFERLRLSRAQPHLPRVGQVAPARQNAGQPRMPRTNSR